MMKNFFTKWYYTRLRFFAWLLRSYPPGLMLSKRWIAVRCLIFPIEMFAFWATRRRTYDACCDCIRIGEHRISTRSLDWMIHSNGATFKVVVTEEKYVYIEALNDGN